MKKAWKLVLCLALAVAMLSCAALAADAPETAAVTGVTLTAAADGAVSVTVPASMVTEGNQYVVILVKVDAGDKTPEQMLAITDYGLSEQTILYIDQNAASSGLTFTGKPKSMASCLVLLGGTDASGNEINARVIGAIKTKGVTVTGTAAAKGATTGNVTVTILNDGTEVGSDTVAVGGTYSISGVPAEANLTVQVSSDIKGNKKPTVDKYLPRTYTLDATAATELNVELWPKGDATGDGRVTAADATAILNSVRLGSTNVLTGYAAECANANGDTRLTAADATAIFNHLRLGSTNVLW